MGGDVDVAAFAAELDLGGGAHQLDGGVAVTLGLVLLHLHDPDGHVVFHCGHRLHGGSGCACALDSVHA